MTSRVTVRVPPELVESARALQYANRRRLAARELASRVTETVQQQAEAAKQSSPLPDNLVGGQLEFAKKKKWKIETRRRRLRSGFLLIPSADYDNQLRLPVLTDYGEREYATTPDDAPFELIEGRLMAKPSSFVDPLYSSTGQSIYSSLEYETTLKEETSSTFTFEFFISLEAGPAQQPLLENLGDEGQRLTSYQAAFNAFFNSGVVTVFSLSKTAGYPLNSQSIPGGSGLRQSWGLVTDGLTNQDILLTPGGGEYHVAVVQSNQVIRLYFDGSLVRTDEGVHDISSGQTLKSSFEAFASKRVSLRSPFGGMISSISYAEGPKSGFRCVRFTPGQALYSGNSFTPPTSITDLV